MDLCVSPVGGREIPRRGQNQPRPTSQWNPAESQGQGILQRGPHRSSDRRPGGPSPFGFAGGKQVQGISDPDGTRAWNTRQMAPSPSVRRSAPHASGTDRWASRCAVLSTSAQKGLVEGVESRPVLDETGQEGAFSRKLPAQGFVSASVIRSAPGRARTGPFGHARCRRDAEEADDMECSTSEASRHRRRPPPSSTTSMPVAPATML